MEGSDRQPATLLDRGGPAGGCCSVLFGVDISKRKITREGGVVVVVVVIDSASEDQAAFVGGLRRGRVRWARVRVKRGSADCSLPR